MDTNEQLSVAPNPDTWVPWGSRSCISRSRPGEPTLNTYRSAVGRSRAASGWSSTGSQIVSKAGKASVQRSRSSWSSAAPASK